MRTISAKGRLPRHSRTKAAMVAKVLVARKGTFRKVCLSIRASRGGKRENARMTNASISMWTILNGLLSRTHLVDTLLLKVKQREERAEKEVQPEKHRARREELHPPVKRVAVLATNGANRANALKALYATFGTAPFANIGRPVSVLSELIVDVLMWTSCTGNRRHQTKWHP